MHGLSLITMSVVRIGVIRQYFFGESPHDFVILCLVKQHFLLQLTKEYLYVCCAAYAFIINVPCDKIAFEC